MKILLNTTSTILHNAWNQYEKSPQYLNENYNFEKWLKQYYKCKIIIDNIDKHSIIKQIVFNNEYDYHYFIIQFQ